MAVSKRLRFEILRRDNHTCRYCGATAPDVKLTVDHVTPSALGGSDGPNNLITACEPCNSGKSSVPADATVVANVAQDAIRWAAALKQAASELEAQEAPKLAYRDAFQQAWNAWTYENGGGRITTPLEENWRTSIERFRIAGLPISVWPDVVEKAMTSRTVKIENVFKYMCGIAWRMVDGLQDRAKAIIKAEVPLVAEEDDRDPIGEAAVQVWVNEWPGSISNNQGDAFTASVLQCLEEAAEEPHRLLQGAQYAAWFHLTDVAEALDRFDRDRVTEAWSISWYTKAGEFPDADRTRRVAAQCDDMLNAGVYVGRLMQAAIYAGAHQSATLHFGLSESELAITKASRSFTRSCEIWAEAYFSSTKRWPSRDEVAAFQENVLCAGQEYDFSIQDLYMAAASAGTYQDADITTCLPFYGSALGAADRRPIGRSTPTR
ncbi:HNH endonuclease [Kitasatospora sp. NPDC059408]|uniref:HNH endonuclease n=1 Tax=Kitasatospora sp. NPDC059408 TaxID=3346823 RepID=UPI003678252A